MPLTLATPRVPRSRRRKVTGLCVEQLETRTLLSGAAGLAGADPNDAPDILSPALSPNLLSTTPQASVSGLVANRADGSGDVDWYRFDLTRAATIVLEQTAGSLPGVLSLYNTTEPFNGHLKQGDRYEVIGHRQLAQTVGGSGSLRLVRDLAPGSYFVAVSGQGNLFFHPLMAGSGHPGQTGDYTLRITATELTLDPAAGPAVLATEPGPGAALASAPLVVRVSLSAPLGPGVTARLQGPGGEVPLDWTNFSTLANELQLAPQRALAPGEYRVVLSSAAGDRTLPAFRVSGVEGGSAAANDAPNGAHDLGDVLGAGFVQRTGTIGDDPAYDPRSGNPRLANPASDVDLYRFSITSDGRFGLIAEVFAGRIGSPLDPGITLFRLNEQTGRLELVVFNDNTFNGTRAASGVAPLFADSLVYAGLTRGHYYLAVSSSGRIGTENLPDGFELLPGVNGVFDPNVSHSGLNGQTRGGYVLNLVVAPDLEPPRVVAGVPFNDTTLDRSPTRLIVQFSEAVNLPLLANRAYFATFPFPSAPAAAYVRGEGSTVHTLTLDSYDSATNKATFLLSGPLPNGSYQLHLVGITDLAGNPLVAGGSDFVIPFTVNDSNPAGSPPPQTDREPNDDPSAPQHLGAIGFGGIVVEGSLSSGQGGGVDFVDFFAVEVTANDAYAFQITPPLGASLPEGFTFLVTDTFGAPVAATVNRLADGIAIVLNRPEPGTYVVMVGFLNPEQAVDLGYRLQMHRIMWPEGPPPLTNISAPAMGLRLADRFQAPPLVNGTGNGSGSDGRVSVTSAGSANSPGGFANVVNGSLAVLSARPLGSTPGVASPQGLAQGDRIQLGNFSTALLAGLVRLTILTPVDSNEEYEKEPAELLEPFHEWNDTTQGSWQLFLDGLFSRADWIEPETGFAAQEAAADVELEPVPFVINPSAWDVTGSASCDDVSTTAGEPASETDGVWPADDSLPGGGTGMPSWALAAALAAALVLPAQAVRGTGREDSREDRGPTLRGRGRRVAGESLDMGTES